MPACKFALGLDLGGAGVRGAWVSSDGEIRSLDPNAGNSEESKFFLKESCSLPLVLHKSDAGEIAYGFEALSKAETDPAGVFPLKPAQLSPLAWEADSQLPQSVSPSEALTEILRLVHARIASAASRAEAMEITMSRSPFFDIISGLAIMDGQENAAEKSVATVIALEPDCDLVQADEISGAARKAGFFPARLVPRQIAGVVSAHRKNWARGDRILLLAIDDSVLTASVAECGIWPQCRLLVWQRAKAASVDFLAAFYSWLLKFIGEDLGLNLSSREASGLDEDVYHTLLSAVRGSAVRVVNFGATKICVELLPDYTLDLAFSREDLLAIFAPLANGIANFLNAFLADFREKFGLERLCAAGLVDPWAEPPDGAGMFAMLKETLKGILPADQEWLPLSASIFANGAALLANSDFSGSNGQSILLK